jgi:hypothetical protein
MKILAILLCAAIVISPLAVMSSESVGPLGSGGAAGVKKAQGESTQTTWIILGAGALVALGVLLALNNTGEPINCFVVSAGSSGGSCPPPTFPPTTTTTTTTGP